MTGNPFTTAAETYIMPVLLFRRSRAFAPVTAHWKGGKTVPQNRRVSHKNSNGGKKKMKQETILEKRRRQSDRIRQMTVAAMLSAITAVLTRS